MKIVQKKVYLNRKEAQKKIYFKKIFRFFLVMYNHMFDNNS